eukprot:1687560-Pleurochrysis_carterae.AAC.1
MSSQSSVHAVCALAGGGMTPKSSACQSSEDGVGVLSTSVVTALISASPEKSAKSLSYSRHNRSRRRCRGKSRGC